MLSRNGLAAAAPVLTVTPYGFDRSWAATLTLSAPTTAPAAGQVWSFQIGSSRVATYTVLTADLNGGPAVALERIAARLAESIDRKSTRLNSSHLRLSRMPSSA